MDQLTFGAPAMLHENAGHRVFRPIGMPEILILSIIYHFEGEFLRYIRDTLANAEGTPWVAG